MLQGKGAHPQLAEPFSPVCPDPGSGLPTYESPRCSPGHGPDPNALTWWGLDSQNPAPNCPRRAPRGRETWPGWRPEQALTKATGALAPLQPRVGQAGQLGNRSGGAFARLLAELPDSLPACGSGCISTPVQLLPPQRQQPHPPAAAPAWGLDISQWACALRAYLTPSPDQAGMRRRRGLVPLTLAGVAVGEPQLPDPLPQALLPVSRAL